MASDFTLEPRGPFSLKAAAGFGFGPTQGRPPEFDGVMRLAFAIDGETGYAGALLRQPEDVRGPVSVQIQTTDGGDPQRALDQVARIVSLDHDGEGFSAVGQRDPVIGALQQRHLGQRPVLFHSPYEAAAWSIISARRPAAQAAKVRTTICERRGSRFTLAGQTLFAFPQPERLLELAEGEVEGLQPEKARRLGGVAQAAREGRLDVDRLHELGPGRAFAEVQRIKGIGPFYAGLVVLRASGFADAPLMAPEPKVMRYAARRYGLQEPLALEQFTQLAERWRPFRTWTTVLIRLAGDRDDR